MANLSVGTIVEMLSPRMSEKDEYTYSDYKIISIQDKNGYYMYLCENVKTKVKGTFTSKDIGKKCWRKPLVKIKE